MRDTVYSHEISCGFEPKKTFKSVELFLFMEQTSEESQLKSRGPVHLKKPSYLLGPGMNE
jgi:hypothetical protein